MAAAKIWVDPMAMQEIRIHGRGGQGAVLAAKIISAAAFSENKHVQSFSAYGGERRGAPVVAFVRLDDHAIRIRCRIYNPHHLIVLSRSLLENKNIVKGLKVGGWIVLNAPYGAVDPEPLTDFKLAVVDANAIALRKKLGTKYSPIVNTAILGAFARATGLIAIESLLAAIEEELPLKKKENIQVAREAYDLVRLYGEK